ncbi:MAG: hypothetical protein LBG81_08030 [Coriobacteriaceae bacterium]|jgi:nitrogenase molybdenum-cofactor synthesis protein NifE|nr:hypothetical protein [Coriobacteriaceae bacterium]
MGTGTAVLEDRRAQVAQGSGAALAIHCEQPSVSGSVSQRACVYCGARVVLNPITDAYHIVHGPIGCASYTWDIRGSLSSGEDVFRTSFSTDLREKDVIFGGEKKLAAAIDELMRTVKPAPRLIFVYATCIVGVIGDDVEAVCRSAEARYGIRVIAVKAPGFSGTKSTGYKLACDAIMTLIAPSAPSVNGVSGIRMGDAAHGVSGTRTGDGTASPLAGLAAPSERSQPQDWHEAAMLRRQRGDGAPQAASEDLRLKVNILGDYNLAGEMWIIAGYLRNLGIDVVSTITGDACLDSLMQAPTADLNIVQCAGSSAYLAQRMEKEWGIPFMKVSFFGIEDSSASLLRIARAAQDPRVEAMAQHFIASKTAEVIPLIEAYRPRLTGKRAAIFVGGGFKAISLIRQFKELGMKTVLVGTQTGKPDEYATIASLVDEGTVVLDDANPAELEAFLLEKGADILVGGVKERPLAYKLGIAFCDHNHERKHPLAGFEGIRNFVSEIHKSLNSPVWPYVKQAQGVVLSQAPDSWLEAPAAGGGCPSGGGCLPVDGRPSGGGCPPESKFPSDGGCLPTSGCPTANGCPPGGGCPTVGGQPSGGGRPSADGCLSNPLIAGHAGGYKGLTALNVNPCVMCMPLGAVSALFGIRKSMAILHGSQGCATYIRRHMATHYNEPIDIASSSLTEEGTVFGGRENLMKGLKNLIDVYQPDLIGVCTTCLAETIGEDVDAIIKEFEASRPQSTTRIVAISSAGYSGSHNEGFFAALRSLVAQLCPQPSSPRALPMSTEAMPQGTSVAMRFPKDTSANPRWPEGDATVGTRQTDCASHSRVAVVTPLLSCADTRWLRCFLESCGLDCILLPDIAESLDGGVQTDYQRLKKGGTSLNDVARLGDCRLALEFSTFIGKESSPAAYLDKAHGVPVVRLPLPLGLRGMDQFLQTVAEAGGVIPPKTLQARARYLDAMADSHKYCADARVAVFGDPDFVYALVRLMCENGILPAVVATGSVCPSLKEVVEQEAQACAAFHFAPVPRVMDDCDFSDIESACLESGANLLIGSSDARRIAQRLHLPLIRCAFPIHDHVGGQRIRTLGFEGSLWLLDAIANALIDVVDAGFRDDLHGRFFQESIGQSRSIEGCPDKAEAFKEGGCYGA